MQGQYAQLLKDVLAELVNWRATADSVNIDLRQLNMKFPDNSLVLFVWDDETQQWLVDTT
jgi:hypothetical protein